MRRRSASDRSEVKPAMIFLAQAWLAANEKARELGSIV
jgi:hypothetical protein